MAKLFMCAGSTRKDSYNKKLITCVQEIAQAQGATCTLVDLKEYPLPLYDGDLERVSGVPVHAKTLRHLMQDADAFVFASPEYNSGISGVFKNMLDWTSRADGNEPSLAAYKNKFACIMSASPGALGGLRGLIQLRSVLQNMGVTVLAEEVTVRHASSAFDTANQIIEERTHKKITAILTKLLKMTGKQ